MNLSGWIGVLPDLTNSLTRFLDLFGIELEAARRSAVKLGIIWALAFLANRLLGVITRRLISAANDHNDLIQSHREKRASTIAGVLSGVGNVVILTFGVILSLGLFVNVGPVLAGAGVVGLAVSFGSQSLVKDVISGFFLLIENQFDVGDGVELAGLTGTVERVSLRTTRIRDVAGVLHVIPNGQITIVSNQSRDWSRRILDIGIGYDADIDRALAVFRDEAAVLAADPAWRGQLDGVPEVVGVDALGDSAVTVRVMVRTAPGAQWAAGREYLRRIKIRLDQEGIDIPFPQRVVHLRPAAVSAPTSTPDGSA